MVEKLESDLENFGRLCHLHDKVAKLEQALAEKDREIAALKGGLECTRSHPHEEMSETCVLKTELARLTNTLANSLNK